MGKYPDLRFLRSEYAHFDIATLSTYYDLDLFGGMPEPPLEEIAKEVLVHEAAHHMQTTGTAAGVKLFFFTHLASLAAIEAAERAVDINEGTLPLGLVWLRGLFESSQEDRQLHKGLESIAGYLRDGVGGTRWREDQIRGYSRRVEQGPLFTIDRPTLDGESTGSDYYIRLNALEDSGDKQAAVQLGTIHLLEGQAAAIEDIGAIAEGVGRQGPGGEYRAEINRRTMARPKDPYQIALWFYEQVVVQASEIHRLMPFQEFSLIVDTALMLEDLELFESEAGVAPRSARFPFETYLQLLRVVARNPKHHIIRSTGHEAMADYQNRLLADFTPGGPDIAGLCRQALDHGPRLIEKLFNGSIGEGFLRTAMKSIRDSFNFRINVYGGSCPLMALAAAPASAIADYLEKAGPWVVGAAQYEESAEEQSPYLFEFLKFKHLRGVADEISYGTLGCYAQTQCMLDRRPSCESVTDQLSERGNRCPREVVIGNIQKNLGFRSVAQFIFDVSGD